MPSEETDDGSQLQLLLSVVVGVVLIFLVLPLVVGVILQPVGVSACDTGETTVTETVNGSVTTVCYAGNGTAEDPFEVSTLGQLQAMNESVDAHYVLVTDIDASETATWSPRTEFAGRQTTETTRNLGFKPIGRGHLIGFTGSLDGQGHSITGLTINRATDNRVGLFASSGGTVTNLSVTNADVTGGSNVGIVVGQNRGRISHTESAGIASGETLTIVDRTQFRGSTLGKSSSNIGGLVGKNTGTVRNSSSAADVDGHNVVGGLVGQNADDGTGSRSFATGRVSGNYYIGGFAGRNQGDVVTSFASGNVSGTNYIGGFTGDNDGFGSQLFATGSVSGTRNIGALAGENDAELKDTFASGTVSGDSYVGGIVGRTGGNALAEDSYHETSLTGTTARSQMTGLDFDTSGNWTAVNGDYPVLKQVSKQRQLDAR